MSNFNPEFLPFTFKGSKDNNRLTRLITPHFQAIYFTYLANNPMFRQKNHQQFFQRIMLDCTLRMYNSIRDIHPGSTSSVSGLEHNTHKPKNIPITIHTGYRINKT